MLWIGSYPFVFFCILVMFVVRTILRAAGDTHAFSDVFTLGGLAEIVALVVFWPVILGVFFGTIIKIGLALFLRIWKALQIEVAVIEE